MLGIFKNLFKKRDDLAATVPKPVSPPTARPPTATPARSTPSPAAPPPAIPISQPTTASPTTSAPVGHAAIPLRSITDRLPATLAKLVPRRPSAAIEVQIPLALIHAQLPKGAVRIALGDLRQLSPAGVFVGPSTQDAESVEIPLAEILPKLKPAATGLREGQKRVHVPEDVTALFGRKGEIIPPPPPPSRLVTPSHVAPAAPPIAPAAEPPPAEPSPIRPIAPLPALASLKAQTETAPAAIQPSTRTPVLAPPAAAPLQPGLHVELGCLVAGWPAQVREVLAPYTYASVNLPLDRLEHELKRGRITPTWGELKSWIQPSPCVAIDESTVLELPLSLVAPRFLATRTATQPKRELKADESIPDLFSLKAASPPPAPPAPVTATSTPQPPPLPPLPAAPVPPTIGEILGQPHRTDWPPPDIVQATATLDGVAGAVLAMHDGFLVAGRMPPDYDLEAFAAFVPELHSRINQYASDLKLVPQEVITVAIGDVPVRIHKTPTVFFAVLGRARAPLPTERLTVIAQHLDAPNA